MAGDARGSRPARRPAGSSWVGAGCGCRAAAAEELQPGDGRAGVVSRTGGHVGHRGGPVAQRAGSPGRAGQLDRRGQQQGLQRRGPAGAGGQPSRMPDWSVSGRPAASPAGCSGSASRSGGPAASGWPSRAGSGLLPPGAQAPTQGASRFARRRRRRRRRSRSSPGRGRGVELLGRGHLDRATRKRIAWCTTRGSRQELGAGEEGGCGQARVDEEAAVVVGAAVRGAAGVGLRHRRVKRSPARSGALGPVGAVCPCALVAAGVPAAGVPDPAVAADEQPAAAPPPRSASTAPAAASRRRRMPCSMGPAP